MLMLISLLVDEENHVNRGTSVNCNWQMIDHLEIWFLTKQDENPSLMKLRQYNCIVVQLEL